MLGLSLVDLFIQKDQTQKTFYLVSQEVNFRETY